MITIVGLGNFKDDLTARGKKAIANAALLCVRTLKTPLFSRFKGKNPVSMDDIFEGAESFGSLNQSIANRLIELNEKHGNVVYLVSGDGFNDGAVNALFEMTKDVEIIQGVSALGSKKPSFSVFSVSASEILNGLPIFDSSIDVCISEIDNKFLASDVKLILLKSYSPNSLVWFMHKGKVSLIQLCDLDRQRQYDHTSSAYFRADDSLIKERYGFNDLLKVMRRLTAVDGCEWDKEQTHESIRINLIEEAYEAVDAIDSGDLDAMIEELGDVMLQSVLHADIASRSGEFDIFDVVHALTHKLVSRHTHIFGKDSAASSQEALSFWEQAKAKEKKIGSLGESMDSVPNNFAALLKAQKLIKKAKKEVCFLDETAVKSELEKRLGAEDFGSVLLLLTALCEIRGKSAEVELNLACGRFKDSCLTLNEALGEKKSVSELV